jgi:3-methyladenine DNA glycosylase/8-oxoguanine DNA glycosylase
VTSAPAVLPAQRRYRPEQPLDLHVTLATHIRGRRDPCHRILPDGAHWRTWRTPIGPATVRLIADHAAGEIDAQAWGEGAQWALDGVPALLGADDDWTGLELPRGVLRDTRARIPGLRLSRTGLVFEALVPAIIEQLVTGVEARRTWVALVNGFGTPAPGPGPAELRILPSRDVLSAITDWEWHRIGLDGRRRRYLLLATQVAGRLDEAAAFDVDAAATRLRSVVGIGQWTAAETLQRSHGAADLISVGDYGLPNMVGYVLTGKPRSDDAAMVALLEPYRPHRQRVVRLVEASGVKVPRYGPRMAVRDYRAI